MDKYEEVLKILDKEYISLKDQEFIIHFFENKKGNSKYIKNISNMKNQSIYLKIMHLIENDMDVSEIEDRRRKYIIKVIDDYKNNNLTNKEIIDYIIYYFVGDNYYNFLVNFNQMLLYMKHINKILISKDHIKFYQDCLRLKDLNREDMILFFNQNRNKTKFFEMFYDDMRIIKNHSYNDLTSKSLTLEKNNKLYDKKLSNKLGIDVYYLDGEEFYAFVRCILPNKDGFNIDDIYCNLPKKYYSFSYIGNKNIGTIDKVNNMGITLLYSNINSNNIVHVHHMDSSSSISSKNEVFITSKINEISSADSLIRDTKCYNEIVIKKDDFGIKPAAIICFNEIQDKDLEISHKYKLPIVLINCNKYYYDESYPDFSIDDSYSL